MFIRFDEMGLPKMGMIRLGESTCGVGYNSLGSSSSYYGIAWENSPGGGLENCRVDFSFFECGDNGQ